MKIAAIILLAVISVAAQLIMNGTFRQIATEVDSVVPDQEKIPEFGWSTERARALRLHRAHYPASALRKRLYLIWWVQALSTVGVLGCLYAFYGNH